MQHIRSTISRRTLVLLALTSFSLGACSDETSPSRGTVQVQLTDAPFAFDSVASVDMFVIRIDARLADSDSLGAEAGKNDDRPGRNPGSEWVTIARPNASFNLLTLQGGKTANLGQTSLPTGTYRGFRHVLDTDKSSITLKNGRVLNGNSTPGIKWPSAGRSGVKIVLDQPVQVTSGQTVLTIDFDLGKSFVMRGNTISHQGLLFKPVIRATATDIAASVAGEVRAGSPTGALVADASVEPLQAGTLVGDTDATKVVATTKSDATGAFKFGFVVPASYALRATPPAGSTSGVGFVAAVAVGNGQVVTGQVIVLP